MKCQTGTMACNINRASKPPPPPPPPPPPQKTASDSGPDPRAVGWCYYCCFSCWEQESQPKWTPVTITRPGGPCSALRNFIGTGEHQQQCLWTINNQFAKGRDEISQRLLSSCLSSCTESLSHLDNHLCSFLVCVIDRHRTLWPISVINRKRWR